MSATFDYETGVPQGRSEAPYWFNTLFVLIMKQTVRAWRQRHQGFLLESGIRWSHSAWADNIVVVANDEQELASMITTLTISY